LNILNIEEGEMKEKLPKFTLYLAETKLSKEMENTPFTTKKTKNVTIKMRDFSNLGSRINRDDDI